MELPSAPGDPSPIIIRRASATAYVQTGLFSSRFRLIVKDRAEYHRDNLLLDKVGSRSMCALAKVLLKAWSLATTSA